ncbi:DUF7547 family protein [Halovivax gelatinilyticus]|uniref:DUF7547 family protein n=1 Tax=Halovivax gelatinilyticus TaxID=2961597 RepID=UPI0020CA3839|nr:hypothetical protein [Halovivax gelatinilyticus]
MSDDDLAEALSELAEAIEALGESAEPDRRRGLRPPTPAQLLRATDDVAIPTLIAILETQVRVLESIQRATRLLRYDQRVRDRASTSTRRSRRSTAERTDAVLDQLGATIDQLRSQLPADEDDRVEASLDRTQSLFEDLERRLTGREGDSKPADVDRGFEIEIDERPSSDIDPTDGRSGGRDQVDVDVEAELDTLRERYHPEHSSSEPDTVDDGVSTGNAETDDSPERPTEDGEPGDASEPTADGDDSTSDSDESENDEQ